MGTPSCHRASPSGRTLASKIYEKQIPRGLKPARDDKIRASKRGPEGPHYPNPAPTVLPPEPRSGVICLSRGRKPAVGCESGAESRSGSIHLVSGGRARLQPRQNLCLGNRAFSPGANSVAKAIPPAALVRWAEAQPFHRFLRSNSWDARLGTACPDRSVLCPVVQAGANRAAKRRRCIETGAQAPGRRMNSSEPRSGDIHCCTGAEALRFIAAALFRRAEARLIRISTLIAGLRPRLRQISPQRRCCGLQVLSLAANPFVTNTLHTSYFLSILYKQSIQSTDFRRALFFSRIRHVNTIL